MNSDEVGRGDGPYVTAALNGDVDNFADLKVTDELRIAAEITSDAKVIPTLVSRRLAAGDDAARCLPPDGAALRRVGRHRGQRRRRRPERLQLALRGSGQALYVGLDDDLYVVASEPYGVVEDATRYLRLDGETPADPADPAGTRGQVVELDAAIGRHRRGHPTPRPTTAPSCPSTADELVDAEVTTRDIDRGALPALPAQGDRGGAGLVPQDPARQDRQGRRPGCERPLGPETLPDAVRAGLRRRSHPRVLVIGQGTAAVAGQSLARALAAEAGRHRRCASRPCRPPSCRGSRCAADMSDTLVVAISQSGTTTDTNRTVDLARVAGARVIAIVNRRASDLTDKSDGVLYTSDGRDVEMSVASTKAFYAQIAAGFLLALAIAQEVPGDRRPVRRAASCSPACASCRPRWRRRSRAAPAIAEAAQELAPSRRYWAIVGSGANRIAAEEIRIKLSELCYKAIACDVTEDKKHIDLSSEPLILVCAAGLIGSNADDVAKEVAIYRAHKATPIVIATEDEDRFNAALRRPDRARRAPRARVRAHHRGRSPVRLRGRAGDRRPARPLREARGRDRGRRLGPAPSTTTACSPSCVRASSRSPPGSSTGCAAAPTTAASRPAPRCGSRRCSATPPASRRSTPTRSSTARSARRAW